jgi:translation elongation factor EF-Tu-like GTPase
VEQKPVGIVTHYFARPHAAVVEVTAGELHVGDTIRVVGHSAEFTQRIESMELDHKAVDSARVGESVGIEVAQPAREHALVYLVQVD